VTFTIKIECGNDAFRDSKDAEIKRILREFAGRDILPTATILLDANGNPIGKAEFKPERKK
jgi:hypothetical protein